MGMHKLWYAKFLNNIFNTTIETTNSFSTLESDIESLDTIGLPIHTSSPVQKQPNNI